VHFAQVVVGGVNFDLSVTFDEKHSTSEVGLMESVNNTILMFYVGHRQALDSI